MTEKTEIKGPTETLSQIMKKNTMFSPLFNEFKQVINYLRKNKQIKNNKNLLPSLFNTYRLNNKTKPFWNDEIKNASTKLYLPSHKNVKPVDNPKPFSAKTWFDIKTFEPIDNKSTYTYKISKTSNQQDDETINCQQIKLYFNKDQKKYMKEIIGIYRYFYNRCVTYFNNYNKETKTSFYCYKKNKDDKDDAKITLRNVLKPYDLYKMTPYLKKHLPFWLTDGKLSKFPSHLIDRAFREAFNRMTIALKMCRRNKQKFKFSYKSKKEILQTINLESCMIKKNSLFYNWEIDNKYMFRNIKTSKPFKPGYRDSSLSYHKVLKTFVLNLNYKVTPVKTTSDKICGIDQGVKTPFVVYSPDNVVEIGNEARKRVEKLCKEIDIISSRMNRKTYFKMINGEKKVYKVTSERKRDLRLALHRKIQVLKNLKNELHNKTVNYLCNTYGLIILPPFNVKEIAKKLQSKLARNLYTFSFYQFKMKLENKCIEKGIELRHLSEAYTSQTCGNCGFLKKNLGNADVYNCDSCNLKIGRDINGARNILLKSLNCL